MPLGISSTFNFMIVFQAEHNILMHPFHMLATIKDGNFPNGMNEGLITMLFKARDKEDLSNWWPITLLNVFYKIFSKALQMKLQPILMEVIDRDQSAFLPLKFILFNVLLMNEIINWVRCINQPLVVLKQIFAKVYDNVNWSFMFDAMANMGIA
jgi:hypothetical protein